MLVKTQVRWLFLGAMVRNSSAWSSMSSTPLNSSSLNRRADDVALTIHRSTVFQFTRSPRAMDARLTPSTLMHWVSINGRSRTANGTSIHYETPLKSFSLWTRISHSARTKRPREVSVMKTLIKVTVIAWLIPVIGPGHLMAQEITPP